MKHINITNWQGNITDWTKFNYIYGGLDDSLADRVNLRIPGTNLRNYLKKSDNLYNIGTYSATIFGVTFSVENQTLTLNGTSTDGSWDNRYELSITLEPGTYTMQWFTDYQFNNIGFGIRASGTGLTELYQLNTQRYKTFTISETTTFTTVIWWATGGLSFNNVKVSCMVYRGDYKAYTTFEPYGSMVMVENVDSNLQPLEPPKVTVFNQVDLGTLDWSGGQVGWYQTYFPKIQAPANNNSKANLSAPGYTSKSSNDVFSPTRGDMGIGVNVTNHYLQLRNTATSSVAEIKALLKGVIMLYEPASSIANTLSMASPMQLDKTNVEEDIEYLEDTKFNEEILSEEE